MLGAEARSSEVMVEFREGSMGYGAQPSAVAVGGGELVWVRGSNLRECSMIKGVTVSG